MTTPEQQQSGDPVAVILARMEVKLDNALTEQARHAGNIDSLDRRVDTLERADSASAARDLPRRLDVLEARVTKAEAKILLWTGAAAALGAGGGVGITKLLGG